MPSKPVTTAPHSRKPRAAADAVLRLDGQLCFALYASSLAMTKLYKPLLAPLGLTYPQYLVMLVLWEQTPVSVSELGDRLYLDSGTLTPLLKRLQTAGWIERERDVQDERRVLLTLTAEGQALRAQARSVPLTLAERTGCSVTELQDLTQRLQALRARLTASSGD
ncbi:MAG: hypothetical protein RJA98_678 [Pseudomonadota bacterium]|jgi:DNA-binding MarR family transcriptional regulator